MVTTGRLSSFVGKGSKPMLLEKISGAGDNINSRPPRASPIWGWLRPPTIDFKAQSVRVTQGAIVRGATQDRITNHDPFLILASLPLEFFNEVKQSSINLLDWWPFSLVPSAGWNVKNICQEDNLTGWSNWETNYVVFQSRDPTPSCRQWHINPIYSCCNPSENLQKTKHRQIDHCNDDRQCIVGRGKEEELIPRL